MCNLENYVYLCCVKKDSQTVLKHPQSHYAATDYIRQGFAVAELQKAVAEGHLPTDYSGICADHVVILVTGGKGQAKINNTSAPLRRGTLLVLQPAAAFTIKVAAETTGWIVSSSTEFIHNGAYDTPVANDALFYQMWTHPVSLLGEEEISEMEGFLAAMDREYKHADDEYKHYIMLMMLRLMMTTLARGFRTKAPQTNQKQSSLFERFYALVESHYTEYGSCQEYAEALAVSPATLLRCTLHVCGLSPIDIHNRRLVAEACCLLTHTTLPVAKITRLLNRNAASNFARFFKHLTGFTPTQYRRQNAEGSLSYFYA